MLTRSDPARRLATLAGALLLTAAACGRSSDADRGAGATASAATTPSAAADSAAGAVATDPQGAAARVACAPDNGGITLPAGFCASIFADSVGSPRHVAVAPNGDVFVALQLPRRNRSNEVGQAPTGAILVLRDADGDGRAEARETFGEGGGTGIGVAPGWVYFDVRDRIVRYPIAAGAMRPSGEPQVVVSGLPVGGHSAHNFALDGRGALYVNVGSLTNSCQQQDRQSRSPGHDPCTELETRAGIWRYSATELNQRFSPAERFATGLRNTVALTVAPDGGLYAAVHGRDQLAQNWGFTPERSAELPAEEFGRIERGDDYGWPYCYYDHQQRKKVLAPEYGGDGTQVGRCAETKTPLVAFPGHWAPMATLFYTGRQFPARYREGAFVAFHGSWNRAPLPQAGFRVAFAPAPGGRFTGSYETFADGFAGGGFGQNHGGQARHRPAGLAQGPDGSIYVTDDVRGRIWKIVYTGAR